MQIGYYIIQVHTSVLSSSHCTGCLLHDLHKIQQCIRRLTIRNLYKCSKLCNNAPAFGEN